MPASEKIGDFIITVINDGIFSYSTDGSIKKELYTGYVCSYAYDKDYIYYVALHEGALFRTTPDGNKTEKLLYVDIATRLYDYYIQGEKLYIKTAINPETGNLDANINYYVSNTSDIKFEPCDEETYNQNLKSKNNFTDGNRSLIIKPVETSENEVEILNMHLQKSKFVVHKNHLYFLSGSQKTKTFLYQMNLDGTGKKIICKIPFDYPINISVIDEMLYINAANIDDEFDDFVITKTPVFLKCNLNGIGLTTVLNSEKNLLPETKILAQKGSIKITDSGIYKNGIVLESNLTIKNAYIFGDDIYYIR
ncbi:MAG: DUF5050 domain-containing protein, partial [Bacteroidota bacterium]|nr:DUF5050 domain-containing protein [Bacteroidota bacterium]